MLFSKIEGLSNLRKYLGTSWEPKEVIGTCKWVLLEEP